MRKIMNTSSCLISPAKSLIFVLIFSVFLIFMQAGIEAAGWQTIDTDHFSVHYPEELEASARKAAAIAEEVHEGLIDYYSYEREDTTHLILEDDSDRAAGVTTPYLLDHIRINISHPLQREFGSSFESWLRLLIAHEYAHVLHLNLREGGSASIRNIFGRVPTYTYPNMFQPYWMLEGYAILAETMLTEGGRAEDAVYDMYMRTAFYEEDLYYFDQIHGQYNLESWPPGGQSVYIYGASIFSYLREKYGKEKLIKLSELYAENPGRGLNSIFSEVYERDAGEIFQDWKRDREKYYLDEIKDIRDNGEVRGNRITEVGHQIHHPVQIPGEDQIVYYHSGEKYPGLRKFDFNDRSDSSLVTGIMAPTGHSFTRDGVLIFSRMEIYGHDRQFYDLYAYDLDADEEIRLTSGGRAHSPVVSGGEIYFIARQADETFVASVDFAEAKSSGGLKKDSFNTILEGEKEEQFINLGLNREDDKLSIVSWRPGGFQDLYIYDLEDDKRTRITRGKENIISPSWSPSGDSIYFSSDAGGIHNIYEYEIGSGEISQLTSEITGAFDPVKIEGNSELALDRSLIYTGYSSDGYDLYHFPLEESLNEDVNLYTDAEKGIAAGKTDPVETGSVDYNLSDHIRPRYFFPTLFIGTGGAHAGITFGGRDPLEILHYQATVEYEGWDIEYPFSYDWDLELNLGRFDVYQHSSRTAGRQLRGSPYYYVDEHTLQGLLPLRVNIFDELNSGLGVTYHRQNRRESGVDEIYQLYGLIDFIHQTGRDNLISTRNISLNAGTAYHDREHNFYGRLDWREYFELPWDHNFNMLGSLARTELEGFYELGGLMGNFPIRGYSQQDTVSGKKVDYLAGEYRMPLWKIKRGMGISPLFFDEISLAGFFEGGRITGESETEIMAGWGGELTLDVELSYGRMPAQISLGAAGNKDDSGLRIYVSPGISF